MGRQLGYRTVYGEERHHMCTQSGVAGGEIAKPRLILIADDHTLFRSALRQLLCQHADLEVVAEAATGKEALERCRRLQPDLVLMEIRMPMDGLEATHTIKQVLPDTTVLILTALEDPNSLAEAIRTGASGHLLKYSSCPEITEAIRKELDSQSALNQEIAVQLLRRLLREEEEPSTLEGHARAPLLRALTKREVEVLQLVASGLTNQQIARKLLLSVSTVKKYLRRILSKLGVSNRTQAAIKALKLGLLNEQDG
jgi:DNA-binding NarL/FixJ family response regulator